MACGALFLTASALSAEEAAPDAADLAGQRAAWLADYAGLKASMQQGYANLDWIVAHRGLDLAALDRRTMERLQAAQAKADAVAAIDDFFAAFHDPHFRPSRGAAPEAALRNAAGVAQGEDAGEAGGEPVSQSCAELGYRARAREAAFDMASLERAAPVSSPYFTATRAGSVGVLRIPSFDEQDYLAACEAAWRPGRTARETQLATRAALQAELARLAGGFRRGGATMLAIDLTGNGGGSEWSEEAAALFTADKLTRPSPRRVVPACDRSGVWRGEAVCANLAPAGEVDELEGTGAWAGPLAVLVDKRSASAAEDFAYWLAGSGVGRLVGERTFGAGCGYIDGGWAYQFKAFDAHAMMPNCSRYTAEGVNQIEGLEPAVAYDWTAGATDLPERLAALTASGQSVAIGESRVAR
jgi:hypothetical protein